MVYLRRIMLGQTFSNLAFLIGLLICGMRYHCQLVVLKEGSSRFLGYSIISRTSNQITGLLSLLQSED